MFIIIEHKKVIKQGFKRYFVGTSDRSIKNVEKISAIGLMLFDSISGTGAS